MDGAMSFPMQIVIGGEPRISLHDFVPRSRRSQNGGQIGIVNGTPDLYDRVCRRVLLHY